MKKKIFFILFLVFLLFSGVCFATEPLYNQSRQDTFFGKYTMQNIVEELGLDEIYSGDALESLTYWANQFMTAFNTYSGDLAIQQLVIHKASNNDLQFYISNASIGNSYDFLYIETQPVYTSMYFTYFDRWVYSGQNISYPLTKSIAGYAFKVNASGWNKASSTVYQVSSFTDSTIYLTNSVTFLPTYAVEGYTQTYGFGQYFLDHTVDVEIAPTPTPVPTATPSASGDYSHQLDNIEYTLLGTKDEIHNMRVDINQGLDDIKDFIPSSGEIKDAQIEAETDYWGSSGDLSGDDMEDYISSETIAFLDSLSGDLVDNPVFSGLHSFEESLKNLFTERDPSKLDLIIEWNDIYSPDIFDSEFKIISGDSLNFSAMCRNDETLGTVQSYIRIIFNFFMSFNILTYIYNLVLSTLGIDNPYLYENPEHEIVNMVYDEDTGNVIRKVINTNVRSKYRQHASIRSWNTDSDFSDWYFRDRGD